MTSRDGLHLPSLLQLILSGAGFIISLSACSLLLLVELFNLASGDFANPELRMVSSLVWITILASILLLPSIVLSGRRILNIQPGKSLVAVNEDGVSKGRDKGQSLNVASGLMVILPILILAGESISQHDLLAWLILPPLSLLVIIIPLWWIFQIGSRGLPRGSAQRQWGLVSVGLVITPWVMLLAELVLITLVAGILLIWLASQPGFIEAMNQLSQSLMDNQVNPDIILNTLSPYMQNPVIIITSLVMAAGLIPMLEELLKPLGMWALVTRKPTAQEGFTAGLICGGTFAMLESLGMLASFSGEGWAVLAVGRMGTGILHSLTTALMGWGLAVAWGKGKYIKLGLIYLVSVTLHGMWNAFSLALAIEPLVASGDVGNPILAALPSVVPLILIVLIILLLALLTGSNRILRREDTLLISG
jgi:hypothetical protein